MPNKPIILLFLCWMLFFTMVGCSAAANQQHVKPTLAALPQLAHNTPSPTAAPTATIPATALAPTEQPIPTATDLPTVTPIPSQTPVPTYQTLRGEVTIAQVVCHYGPGAPYLYKYGVYQGSNLEIIARDEISHYVEIQAIGGNNPCWVKAEYLKIKGDLESLRPIRTVDVKLPISPYYGPPTGISARREGDTVTVFWHAFPLRAGDDSEQVPYLIEAWVCKAGQVTFTPLGAYGTALKIQDEAGCAEASHGRFFAAEKHGYAGPVEIPWPELAVTP